MQAAANSNLILTDLSSFKRLAGLQKDISHAAFYQHVLSELIRGVHRKQTFTELGNNLVALAEHAYGLRRTDVIEQVSQVLIKLLVGGECEGLGRYYEALCLHQKGRFVEARALLECVAGRVPQRYRARILLAISATFGESGDSESFLSSCVDASHAAACPDCQDSRTFVISERNIAVLKSLDGDHRGALSDLEKLFPLARTLGRWQPYLYYEHLNSLSVELMEVGRLEEARNASQIVVASPFASAYPEWRETREEIELRGWHASRSTVAVTQKVIEARNEARRRKIAAEAGVAVTQENTDAGNIITLPTARRDPPVTSLPTESQQLARVIEFPSGTSSMSEENERDQFELSEKQTFGADKLYDMFMSTLQKQPIDLNLVDKLYKVFLAEKRKGD